MGFCSAASGVDQDLVGVEVEETVVLDVG